MTDDSIKNKILNSLYCLPQASDYLCSIDFRAALDEWYEHFLEPTIKTLQDSNTTILCGKFDIIDLAADQVDKSREDFIMEAATTKAEKIILDRSSFILTAEEFALLQDLINSPPKPNEALLKALKSHNELIKETK